MTVLKDGVAVDLTGDHVKLVRKDDQCNVNIKNATEADSGEYTICASNSEGTVAQKVNVSIQPYVYEAFRIDLYQSSRKLKEEYCKKVAALNICCL